MLVPPLPAFLLGKNPSKTNTSRSEADVACALNRESAALLPEINTAGLENGAGVPWGGKRGEERISSSKNQKNVMQFL